jgi:hypothetical protein
MKTRIVFSVLACASLSLAAQAADPWDSPFAVQAGAFWAQAKTSVRLDGNGGRIGTEVSLESDLNVSEKKTTPDIEFYWRFNPNHAMEFSYVSLHRSGERPISGTINWGDVTFPVSTTVDTKFDSDVYRIAYRWSPVHENGAELGLLLGLHWTTLKTSMASKTGASTSYEASVDVPLPTIGIRGSAAFNDNWRITGFGQALKLKIGDYDGSLLNGSLAVEWAFMRQAYAGLGYNYYKYKLTSTKDHAKGSFDFRFDGPALYVGWAF